MLRLDALGTVTPLQSVAVRTRVDGQITAVLFREGDTVRAGQPLFRLDDRAVRAQIAQSRAALASASATSAQAAADLKLAPGDRVYFVVKTQEVVVHAAR